MKITSVDLKISAVRRSQYPTDNKPEFLMVGRSNVGKSSFINTMINRKNYARTSATPGKTQTINFYNINNAIYFVDLPGYGYAKVSQETKKKWGKMIENYLLKSKKLRIIFLLIDIRHEPSQNDIDMFEWILHYGFNPIIVATKSDKLKRSQLQKHISVIRKTLNCIEGTPIIPFSSLNKSGREEVWEYIEASLEAYEAEEAGDVEY